MKKIGIIGQFPPPVHGLSKALDTLYNSSLKEKYNLIKFDITDNKKIIKRIIEILKSDLDVYYLTISQSKMGNIRDLILLKLIQLKKKKSIIHLHGGGFRNIMEDEFSRIQISLNYNILKKVDKVIVLGESLKGIFKDLVDEERIVVVKNCVDNEFVIDDDSFNNKMKLYKDKERFQILYLSNFIEEKGYKEVLELAKYTKEKNNDMFKFVFAGRFFKKQDEDDFCKYVSKNNLQEVVEYKGIVSGIEKKELLKISDYFILLTRYKNEGQPISIIESAINGLRIITTNHAGIKDILNETEMIMLNKDKILIEEIYTMINQEYLEREKIVGILEGNRKKIRNGFSQESYLNSIDKIFNDI